jgi:GR25 family glycosyltransferase involved in LPS biosynthesis
MKFFITHYTPLTDRKNSMIKQFEHYGIHDYEFIETHDRECLTEEEVNKFSGIKLAERSLFLKHVEIYKKKIDDIIIVMEDDSIFCEDFMKKLNLFLSHLPEKWDVLFTGECCNLHVDNIQQNQYFYRFYSSRGGSMYLLNKNTSAKLASIFENEHNIHVPIDHWFNDICSKYHLDYYLSEPTLVTQGSEIGVFPSSLR